MSSSPQQPTASTEPQTSSGNSNSRSRRRKPRKLNRNEPSVNTSDSSRPPVGIGENVMSTEISALKSRVEEIESKMRTLQQDKVEKKIPRRRMKKEKTSTVGQSDEGEVETEQDELLSLGTSLALAKRELAAKIDSKSRVDSNLGTQSNERESSRRRKSQTVDEVEEIPRVPESEPDRSRVGLRRAVTISGSYRLPIPDTVTDGELSAVHQGLKSFQSIARKYIDDGRRDSDQDFQKTNSGTGWSSWFGGYSMSVAKVINNIKLEPGSSSNAEPERPPAAVRSRSEPIGRKKPRKLRIRNGNNHERTIAELEEGGGSGLLS